MASPATPSTPAAQTMAQTMAQPTPTGAWTHPQFDEITRRQYRTTFDERNVKALVTNGSCLILARFAPSFLSQWSLVRTLVSPILTFKDAYGFWSNLPFYCVQALFIVNMLLALSPLFYRYYWNDDIADIPLTPSQRQALRLKPDISAPQTPGSAYASPNYITPPRYQRSTPRGSISSQSERRLSGTPLSGSGSPMASMAKSTSNSPFSPNTGSPLFQKAMGGGSATRRLSYDSRGSPMASNFFGESSSSNTPGTPTPGVGKASVGLNNKWLYEKGRGSPRGSFSGSPRNSSLFS